jgi:U32 family peptidase
MNKKIELLAPAGNLEKLKYAFHYGADAVYAGVPDVSLRVRINNFDKKTICEGVEYAHKLKKKIYITVNIYAHNRHLKKVEEHLKFLKTLNIDGVIISDPGIIEMAKEILPNVEIHLSTQANATNWRAVKFWLEQGVKRVILAREVSLSEIKEIKKRVPKMELEYFIHGAMCMSYSGRCILSKWMNNRSANLGDCTQPCRWKYEKVESKYLNMQVLDDQKRFEMNVEEDQHGTYFFNSRDLNLTEYIQDLIGAGITSLKIEGRAKSIYYVALVCRSYRNIIDAVSKKVSKKELKKVISESKKELENLANRGYTTGFLLGKEPEHNFTGEIFWDKFKFVGEILGREGNLHIVKVHNEISMQDFVEASTKEGNKKIKIAKIYNDKKQEISEAHGGHKKNYFFKLDKSLEARTLLKKKI